LVGREKCCLLFRAGDYPAPHGHCQLLLLPAVHTTKQYGAALTLPAVVQFFSKMTRQVNVFSVELEREGVHV